MSKHTPGPYWTTQNMYTDCIQIWSKNDQYITELQPEHFDSFDTALATARIMAASPQLLEALQAAISAHGRTVEQAIDDVPLEEWEVMARAALEQALLID